jgi:hypothetical protein
MEELEWKSRAEHVTTLTKMRELSLEYAAQMTRLAEACPTGYDTGRLIALLDNIHHSMTIASQCIRLGGNKR